MKNLTPPARAALAAFRALSPQEQEAVKAELNADITTAVRASLEEFNAGQKVRINAPGRSDLNGVGKVVRRLRKRIEVRREDGQMMRVPPTVLEAI